MIFVIIHWMIRPNEEHRRAFLAKWTKDFEPPRNALVGEFLSRPVNAEETGFPCDLLGIPSTNEYWSYFNVGAWESVAVFKRDIYDVFGDSPQADFEAKPRERLVLDPQHWRIGDLQLPGDDKLDRGSG